VSETPPTNPTNLLEVAARAGNASHIIAGFALAVPTLSGLWRQVDDSVSDVRVLAAEIARLRDRLNACRIDRANLAAAGRVTITAYDNGEPDPLACLRDELHAQGFGAGGQGRGDI
jgi:outer membrane murein-binding lipoprotein Lpp